MFSMAVIYCRGIAHMLAKPMFMIEFQWSE